MRLAAPALARFSPTSEKPRISLREMADGELSAELAEAEKAFETANANWAADPDNFGLEKVKLSADLAVKEIEFKIEEAKLRADLVVKENEYKICAAKVEKLVAQSKKKNDAQVREAKAARDDAREERNKAEARLDEFTKSQGTAISPSPT